LLLVAHRLEQDRIYVHPRGGLVLPSAQVFARDEQLRARVVSGFADFDPDVLALWVDESEQLVIVKQQNEFLVVQQFDAAARQTRTASFDLDLVDAGFAAVAGEKEMGESDDRKTAELASWIETRGGWCSHLGRSLLEFSKDGEGWLLVAELPRPAVRLIMSRHTGVDRCVACMERGARIWFGDLAQCDAVTFAEHLLAPWAAFLGNGRLVAADERCIECFTATSSREFRHVGSLPLSGGRPIALAPLARNDQVGLITDRGEVKVLQFSS
jgi:hypothetical protein